MNCIHYRGKLEKGTAPMHFDRKGWHLTLNSVPGWVCTQCGEAFFEDAEVDSIQELAKVIEQRSGTLGVRALPDIEQGVGK